MKTLIASILLSLVAAAASAAAVQDEMIACSDREDLYHLVRIAQDQGSQMFMANALRLAKGGQCRFLHKGQKVEINQTHWMGTVCVEGDDFEGCLWVVRDVITE
ncbi:hypothetical protein GA830_10320 [Mesorhizobium sp. NBSH29]|uniref:hypothetical protein n=1 Tax=Mesorhizobium sp. NBSH29 TaxID=2654249 RepID=UPI0018967099|nr:hypothetical protein [Mesorhizobium sp. NBSH29]QPC87090.1 hypothetical protein GA830_10320 [Mesorhizobium sp. NBSH29]